MDPEQTVRVALVAGGRAPDTLSYAVPEPHPDWARPGTVVTVPLGNRLVPGIVLGPDDEDRSGRLREIHGRIGDSTIPPHVLELATWASRYYRAPESLLRRSLLPPDARRQTRRHIIPIPDPDRAIGLFDAVATMGPLEDRIWASLPPEGLSLPGLRSTWGRETEAAIRKLK